VEKVKTSLIFHAGTKRNDAGELITAGGRILAITSLGKDLQSALTLSNKNAEKITFENKQYRKDVGKDLIK
jgi:phosphoribosylamine--glycine ligase